MSGLGDGIGTVIEGGLLGRAVEPKTGEGGEHASGPATCANCQTIFSGHYCPECGQKAHVHRSLTAIGHDIMHGVLHLDGKLWDTLPLLAFKPGDLTRRYIAGERAKFVSPMAMFLFTVFAMFAVFQMVGISPSSDFAEGWNNNSDESSAKGVFQKNIQQQITELEKERDGLSKGDERRDAIDAELAIIRKMIGQGKAADADVKAEADTDGTTKIAIDKTNTVVVDPTTEEWLGSGIIKKWKQNPSLMLYKLQSNGYKFSWLLIPLSVPFLWLMFAWRRQFKAYDHAIFVTYSLSFMSLLFIVMSILSVIPGVGSGWAFLLFAIAAPLHLYKQLRYAYGLSRFSAMWRFFVLINFIPIVLALFAQVLLVLGAF
jgi:Protein of unknown function (DUF3667)